MVGKVTRTRPVEVEDLKFLRARTDRTIKITLPGPFTMSQQASNEAYGDEAELAMDLAVAVNEEIRDRFEAGADIVQIDEPWLQSRAEKAREFALPAINRALQDQPGTTALHTCFGYAAVVDDKPEGYPFLAELADCTADALAIEAAQPGLDPATLEPIAHKTVILGVTDLSTVYVDKLGLEVGTDADLGAFRWLTVHVPGKPESSIVLSTPEMGHDEETAAAIRDLLAKGGGSGMIFTVDDCRKAYEELLAKGVEFTQEPTEHFYGIDCGLRDPFGNPLRITQPAPEPIQIPSREEFAARAD